jgi:hypothetical protein
LLVGLTTKSSKRNSQQACPTASFPIWRRPAWSYGVVAKWAALVGASCRLCRRYSRLVRQPAKPSHQAPPPSRRIRWQIVGGIAACVVVGSACLACTTIARIPYPSQSTATVQVEEIPDQMRPGTKIEMRSRLEQAQCRVTELQQQVEAAESQYRQSSSTARDVGCQGDRLKDGPEDQSSADA